MLLVYEPEAAALFTQYDFLHNEENFTPFCYLVVDCGGGTIDLAAHKVTKQNGNIIIENLVPPHGGHCGGFAVNDQFEKLMQNILNIPAETFKQLKINCAVQWTLLIQRHFEENKVTLDPKTILETAMCVEIVPKICEEVEKVTGKSFEELIADYGDENIEWDDDESAILLYCCAVDKLFEPVLNDISTLIKSVLVKQECNEVNTILLAGGFAESYHLFKYIKDTFGKDYTVCRSSTPTFSVVKGAVLCGQQENLIKSLLEKIEGLSISTEHPSEIQPKAFVPQHTTPAADKQIPESSMQIIKYLPPAITKHLPFILSRKMKYTIGVQTVEEFRNGYHDINRLVVIDEEQYCGDIFHTLVKANESVYAGSPKRVYKFNPASIEQSTCVINIYASSKENVRYVDEEGCKHRRNVEISNLPKSDTDLSREVELHINFFNTEVELTAYSVTNSENKKRVTVDYKFM